jgi:MscS family membrane protein
MTGQKRIMFKKAILTALFLTLLPGFHLFASERYPLEPADTVSPRNTYKYFVEQMNSAYNAHLHASYKKTEVENIVKKAVKCLDLSQVARADKEVTGLETALLLKEVLDRIPTPPYDKIPDAAMVNNKIDLYVLPHTSIQILRMADGPRKGEFLFSSRTVEDAAEAYNHVKHLPYKPGGSIRAYEDYLSQPGWMIPQRLIKRLPQWMTFRILNATLWQLMGLLFCFFMIGTILFVVNRFTRVDEKKAPANYTLWTLRKLLMPLSLLLLLVLLKYFAEEQISITGSVWQSFKNFMRFVVMFTIVWAVYNLGRGMAEAFIASEHMSRRQTDANLIRMLFRLGTFIVIFLILWNASEYFGIPLTAVFASAGIFGMAVALAARETLANLFGGASLLLDRPFKTGDYITLDTGERGKVLEVGLRSTRILTRDDVLITMPNSIITNSKIINESAPKSDFRVRIQVGVAYGSDIAKVEEVLLQVAAEEKMVKKKPAPSVMLRGFGTSSVDFELLCQAYWARDKGMLMHCLYKNVYLSFQEAGLVIPFPQRDIHIQGVSSSEADKALKPEQF